MLLLEKSANYISDKIFSFLIVNKQLTQKKDFVVSLWACSDKFIYFVTLSIMCCTKGTHKFL